MSKRCHVCVIRVWGLYKTINAKKNENMITHKHAKEMCYNFWESLVGLPGNMYSRAK